MSGYAVAGRIRGAAVHVRSAAPSRDSTGDPPDQPPPVDASRIQPRDASGVRDRVADLVVAIDQLTWYLRSPESWR